MERKFELGFNPGNFVRVREKDGRSPRLSDGERWELVCTQLPSGHDSASVPWEEHGQRPVSHAPLEVGARVRAQAFVPLLVGRLRSGFRPVSPVGWC